jgi:hypothetical protein
MTALEQAQAELADSFTPHPDEFMDAYSPQAALLFLRQVSMACLKVVTGAAASINGGEDEEQPTLNEVLNGVSAAVAGSTHALVALEVLPIEAEEALVKG